MNVENLTVISVTQGNDSIGYGNDLGNVITASQVFGRDGNDTLNGYSVLDGGNGFDVLNGLGPNLKWFILHSQANSTDTVNGYLDGTDLLRISETEFGISNAGLATHLFNNTAVASGANNGAELLFDSPNSTLYYDADGVAGGSFAIAILTGVTASLTTADFEII